MTHHTHRVAAVAIVLTLWGCGDSGNGGTGVGGSGGQQAGGKAGAATGTAGASGSTSGLACRHGTNAYQGAETETPYCACTLGATPGSTEWPDASCGPEVLGGDVVCEVTQGSCVCGLYWCIESATECRCGVGLWEEIPAGAKPGSCKKEYCSSRGRDCRCSVYKDGVPNGGSDFTKVASCSAAAFAAENTGKIVTGTGFADACTLLTLGDFGAASEK